jgi:hypothetical protein
MFCGPLTSRRIAKYQKQGYYGKAIVKERVVSRKSLRARKMTKEQVFKLFEL